MARLPLPHRRFRKDLIDEQRGSAAPSDRHRRFARDVVRAIAPRNTDPRLDPTHVGVRFDYGLLNWLAAPPRRKPGVALTPMRCRSLSPRNDRFQSGRVTRPKNRRGPERVESRGLGQMRYWLLRSIFSGAFADIPPGGFQPLTQGSAGSAKDSARVPLELSVGAASGRIAAPRRPQARSSSHACSPPTTQISILIFGPRRRGEITSERLSGQRDSRTPRRPSMDSPTLLRAQQAQDHRHSAQVRAPGSAARG